MLEKTISHKESCNELIELALVEKGIYVVAVGPPSCLRVLYFRAMRAGLSEKYYSFTLSSIDVVSGSYEERLIEFISNIIEERIDLKGVILYLSCSEILTGMDFSKINKVLKEKYNTPIYNLSRGPLAKRNILPREKMKELIKKIHGYI